MEIRLNKNQTIELNEKGKVVVPVTTTFDVVVERINVEGEPAYTTSVKRPNGIKVVLCNLKTAKTYFINAHYEDMLFNKYGETNIRLEVNEHLNPFEDFDDAKRFFIKMANTSEYLKSIGKLNQFDHLVLVEVSPKGRKKNIAEWKYGMDIIWFKK